jgi:outer membrane translocation and assembly module TamA
MFLLHLEYRLNIAKNLYLGALMDWGDTWERSDFKASQTTVNEFVDNAPLGAGLCIAYASILGPVRLSWGRRLHGSPGNQYESTDAYSNENVLYFSAGYDF